MKYDAEHKGKTRDRVLAEAARALRAVGPDRLAIADVMRAAGLTVGGFYAHFRSKDDLMAHAIKRAVDEFDGVVDAAPAEVPAAERFGRLVRFYLSRQHRDAPESGCPLPGLASRVHAMGEDARRHYAAGFGRLSGRVERLLTAAGVANAAAAASSVTAEMIGALTLSRATMDPDQSDAILRRSRDAILARCGAG